MYKYSYRVYHYANGVLCWMISSIHTYGTKEQALKAAREDAKKDIPQFEFSKGAYEETEQGAKIWFSLVDGTRIHMEFKVV